MSEKTDGVKYWDIRNQTDTSADLYLYSEISTWGEMWGDTSAKDVVDAIKALGKISRLNICINSPGGSVTEAMAIKSFLARQTFEKTVYIDGLCASAATVIAFGIGGTVNMESSALVMIHNSWARVNGNAADLRKAADDLDKYDVNIRQIYVDRTAGKLTEDKVREMMDAETWLSADECLEYGFVDEVVSNSTQAAACLPKEYFGLYKNIPKGVIAKDDESGATTPENSITAETQAIINKANAALKEYRYRKEYENYGN